MDADDPRIMELEQERLRDSYPGNGPAVPDSYTCNCPAPPDVAQTQTQTQTQNPEETTEEEENPFLSDAIAFASLENLPSGAEDFGDVGMRLLALCRSLSWMNRQYGRDGFYLSCRAAANALGCPGAHRRILRMLTAWFPRRGWLAVVERGDQRPGGLANLYRWVVP